MMKKIFHRNLTIYEIQQNKSRSIIPNIIIDKIQTGNSFTLIWPYEGSPFVLHTKNLISN